MISFLYSGILNLEKNTFSRLKFPSVPEYVFLTFPKRQSTTCTNFCYLLIKTTNVLRMTWIHTCLIISRFFQMYSKHKVILLRWCISWYWSHLCCIVPGVVLGLYCDVQYQCGVWIHYIGITSVGCCPARPTLLIGSQLGWTNYNGENRNQSESFNLSVLSTQLAAYAIFSGNQINI